MKIKLIILLLISTVFSALSQENTRYSLKGGLGLSINMHNASFSNLPGFPGCCPEYSSTIGFAPYIYAGIEYDLQKRIFGLPISYSLAISYQGLNGEFEEEEFIGNVLYEDTYQESISKHTLAAIIGVISTEHTIKIQPFENIPLDIFPGIVVGFPISGSFEQNEELIQPADRDFSEGGKNRNTISEDIPDLPSVLAGLSIGANYSVINVGNGNLKPFVKYNYFFNDLSGVDWKVSAIMIGGEYYLPLKEKLPESPAPQNPPVPEYLPEPEMPTVYAKPNLNIIASIDNRNIDNGDDISIEVQYREIISIDSYPPVLYFSKESIDVKSEGKEILNIISDNNKEIETIRLIAFTTNESSEIAMKRNDRIKSILIESGIDEGKITSRVINQSNDSFRYTELEEEAQRVNIIINNENLPITKTLSERVLEKVEDKTIKITPQIIVEATPALLSGKVELNEMTYELTSQGLELSTAKIYENNQNNQQISIKGNLIDSQQQKDDDELEFSINYTEKVNSKEINYSNEVQSSEFILGYFNFDETTFYSLNLQVKEFVKNALNSGKKVVIIPLTDNLGTAEYNRALKEKRANAALSLFEQLDSISVNYDLNSPFDTSDAYGRAKSRAILVRIK